MILYNCVHFLVGQKITRAEYGDKCVLSAAILAAILENREEDMVLRGSTSESD